MRALVEKLLSALQLWAGDVHKRDNGKVQRPHKGKGLHTCLLRWASRSGAVTKGVLLSHISASKLYGNGIVQDTGGCHFGASFLGQE